MYLASLTLIYVQIISNKKAGCTESLLLNKSSAGRSGQQLSSSPTDKCSNAEITNAVVILLLLLLLF